MMRRKNLFLEHWRIIELDEGRCHWCVGWCGEGGSSFVTLQLRSHVNVVLCYARTSSDRDGDAAM